MMKNILKISGALLILCMGVMVMSSCKKDKGGDLTIADTEFALPSSKSQASFLVVASGSWSAVSNAAWCTIDHASGKGDQRITVTAEANQASEVRKAVIRVTSGSKSIEVNVTQSAFGALSLTPTSFIVSKDAGVSKVELSASSDWQLRDVLPAWLTISASEGAGGVQELELSYIANPDEMARNTEVVFQIKSSLKDTIALRFTQLGLRGNKQMSDSLALHALFSMFDLSGLRKEDQAASQIWDPTTPFKEWTGVKTTLIGGETRVTTLLLSSVVNYLKFSPWKLHQPLPDDIRYLTELRELSCTDLGLGGAIPAAIGDLTKLESLDFEGNHLTGNLPETMVKLQKLKVLNLSCNNYFEGDVPAFIGELLALEQVSFAFTSFGKVPDMFAKLQNLETLRLNNMWKVKDDQGGGDIVPMPDGEWVVDPDDGGKIWVPKANSVAYRFTPRYRAAQAAAATSGRRSIGGVTGQRVGRNQQPDGSWQENGTSGNGLGSAPERQFPTSLLKLTKLRNLYVNTSNFVGELPATMGESMPTLEQFMAYDNKFTGSLPASLALAPILSVLNVSTNQFSGNIPAEFGKCTYLRAFILANNAFEGSLPGELGKCTELQVLNVSNNKLSGVITNDLLRSSNYQEFNISFNKFTGVIPANIGNHNMMWYFNISNNSFTALDDNIKNAVAINEFIVSDNLLTAIPDGVKYWAKCASLNFANNNITGTIPSGVYQMHGLSLPQFYGNRMSGVIPEEFLNHRNNRPTTVGSIPSVDGSGFINNTQKNFNWSLICPQQSGFGFSNCPRYAGDGLQPEYPGAGDLTPNPIPNPTKTRAFGRR